MSGSPRLRSSPLLLAALLTACSSQRTAPIAARPPAPPPPRTNADAALPPASPKVMDEVLGWVVVADGAPLVRAAAQLFGDPRLGSDDRDGEIAAKVLMLEGLGIEPRLATAIDLRRPAAVALLDPSAAGEGARPVMAMLPVAGRAEVEQALAAAGVEVQRRPWGLEAQTASGAMFLAFREGYLAVAWRPELLAAAERALDGPLHRRAEAALVGHVDVASLYRRWGGQLTMLLGQLGQSTRDGSDPQLAFAMRGAVQLARFADSVRALDLLVDSGEAGLTLTVRLDGRPDGAWAGYVASQQPGPAWGSELVPLDAVLVYATHRTPSSAHEELEAAVSYLGDATVPPAPEPLRRSWREALGRACDQLSGEMVYAVWPGHDGGLGLGGAYRVRSSEGARRELGVAYRRIGRHLGGVVLRSLHLAPERFPVSVTIGRRAAGAVPVDTVEVAVRWPRSARAERRLFEQLFGPRLVMATAFVGDRALFAIGRDWQPRIGELAARAGAAAGGATAAQGGNLAGGDPAFGRALDEGAAERVSFSYLPMQPMGRFIADLLRQGRGLDAHEANAVEPLLAATGGGAIVSTTRVRGTRYELTTRVPASALPGMQKIGGILWRVALSPLLNPPALPPLPVPPAQVTPRMPEPRPENAESGAGPHTL